MKTQVDEKSTAIGQEAPPPHATVGVATRSNHYKPCLSSRRLKVDREEDLGHFTQTHTHTHSSTNVHESEEQCCHLLVLRLVICLGFFYDFTWKVSVNLFGSDRRQSLHAEVGLRLVEDIWGGVRYTQTWARTSNLLSKL